MPTGGGGSATKGDWLRDRFAIQAKGRRLGQAGSTSRLSSDQKAEIQRAVNDAVTRNPDILTGPYKLQSVELFSHNPASERFANVVTMGPDGGAQPGRVYLGDEALIHDNLARDIATSDAQAVTNGNPELPTRIMVDDTRWDPTEDKTPYEVVAHEMGHVEHVQAGIVDQGGAAEILNKTGFGPSAVLTATGSMYAASRPAEALAELSRVAHTPEGLLGGFAGKYEEVEHILADHRADYEASGAHPTVSLARARAWPKRDSPLLAELRESAKQNLAADAWVSLGPDEFI